MNKYLIIYHKEDNDGLFSMAIIYNYLVSELKISIENIDIQGHDYNSIVQLDIEEVINNYHYVIMTDISMPADKMKHLYSFIKGEFTWIDHHAPIIKESNIKKFDIIHGVRDTSRSAILNAYRYFYDPLDVKYNNKELPELLRVLSAWDSFSYEREGYDLDYVRNINVGANITYKLQPTVIVNVVKAILYPETDYIGDFNSDDLLHSLLIDGRKFNDAKDAEYADIIKNVGDMSWTVNNQPACALFMQGQTNSLMFKSVKDKVKHGIVFKRNCNGNWTMSIYNTDTEYDKQFHCGNYIKAKYNGGGHAGAAGCQITEEKFIELLKTHKV